MINMKIDKQKKIILLSLPLVVIFIFMIFYVIFKFVFKREETGKEEIITEIPDVNQKIEGNKIEAYNNQRVYDKSENRTSDFLLTFDVDTNRISVKDEEKEISSDLHSEKSSNTLKRLKQEMESTERQHRQLETPEATEKTRKSKKKNGIQKEEFTSDETYPDPVKFNSISAYRHHNPIIENGVVAYIHNKQTVSNHSPVKVRVGKAFSYKNTLIPENTILWGVCRLNNGRVFFTIHSISIDKGSVPCKIIAYDTDGQEGISIHDAGMEVGKKNIASSSKKIGTTLGTAIRAISSTTLAGEIAGTASEGIVKSVTDGISNQIKLKEATLTNNYMFYLKFD